MSNCTTIIRNVSVEDGSGRSPEIADVAIHHDRIVGIGNLRDVEAQNTFDGEGKVLAPGFIDVHTHDDTSVIRTPQMLPKLSQGVTTVVVGNCGISAAPVQLRGEPPDPMNLLGEADAFRYPTFSAYVEAVACRATGCKCRRSHRAYRTAQQSHGSPGSYGNTG